VSSFFARGPVEPGMIQHFVHLARRKRIEWHWLDAGDKSAGWIRVQSRDQDKNERKAYQLGLNRNHSSAVQFSTLAHELGHLFLGHLGPDRHLNIPERHRLDHATRELEAESVAYIVCSRNGVQCRSQTYLANFVQQHTTVDNMDVYQVMRAAGQVETLLELSAHTKYDLPPNKERSE
jgi:hypothetical protein